MHFVYDGDDAEFISRYGSLLADPQHAKKVLAEVREQRDKRLRTPAEAEARKAAIACSYAWLHPELRSLDPGVFLTPAFLEIAAACRVQASGPAEVSRRIANLKFKKLISEIRPGLWTFPVFTESFCNLIEGELCHFLASGLPHAAPNTMNRFGVILAELGLGPKLLDPLVFDYINGVASCLLAPHTGGLDSYRAFTVLYDYAEDGDRDLALHYDNAEVTLNVNIGGAWEGGQVAFYGLADDVDDAGSHDRRGVDVVLERGHGVFHAGLDMHQARPITADTTGPAHRDKGLVGIAQATHS